MLMVQRLLLDSSIYREARSMRPIRSIKHLLPHHKPSNADCERKCGRAVTEKVKGLLLVCY